MKKIFLEQPDVILVHPAGSKECWYYLPDEKENPMLFFGDAPCYLPRYSMGSCSIEYCVRNFKLMTRPVEGHEVKHISQRFNDVLATFDHVPADEASVYTLINAPEDEE